LEEREETHAAADKVLGEVSREHVGREAFLHVLREDLRGKAKARSVTSIMQRVGYHSRSRVVSLRSTR
jgi:hypothetical protein